MVELVNTRTYNYAHLLIGLLVYLLSLPILFHVGGPVAAMAADLMIVIVILAGVLSIASSPRLRALAWKLLAIALILRLSTTVTSNSIVYMMSVLPVLAFCLLFSWIALKDVLFGGRIDVNRLMGAVSIYLLLGIIWALLYLFVHIIVPGSFSLDETTGHVEELEQLIYYSFVTLTTLGYGDVSPGLPVARTFAYLEAAFGQLYLTILVAALVGMLLSPETNKARASNTE